MLLIYGALHTLAGVKLSMLQICAVKTSALPITDCDSVVLGLPICDIMYCQLWLSRSPGGKFAPLCADLFPKSMNGIPPVSYAFSAAVSHAAGVCRGW